jgi:hypothetical protein
MTATVFFSSNSLAFSVLSIIYSIFRIEFMPNKFCIITDVTVQLNIKSRNYDLMGFYITTACF